MLAGLVAAVLVLAGLVAAVLVLAGLVAAGPSPWWPPARRPGGRRPVALVAAGPSPWWPRSAVRGPCSVSERSPTRGPKKRAGSLAAPALALFYTVRGA